MPTSIPPYELLRALRFADLPAALSLLQGHLAAKHYVDAKALLQQYAKTHGVTQVDVARLTVLLRDLLSGYPTLIWAIPCAVSYRTAASWVSLPVIDSLDLPTDILSAHWLPIRNAMARQATPVAQLFVARPQVALLILETSEYTDAPTLDLHQRWLVNQFGGVPAGDSVRLGPGSPIGLPMPEAIEAGLLLQALVSGEQPDAVTPARYFLTDAGYFAVLKAAHTFRIHAAA